MLLRSVVDGQWQIINLPSRTFAVSPPKCQVKGKGNGWKKGKLQGKEYTAAEALFIRQRGVLPPLAAVRWRDAFAQLPWVYEQTQQGNISPSNPPFGCSPMLMQRGWIAKEMMLMSSAYLHPDNEHGPEEGLRRNDRLYIKEQTLLEMQTDTFCFCLWDPRDYVWHMSFVHIMMWFLWKKLWKSHNHDMIHSENSWNIADIVTTILIVLFDTMFTWLLQLTRRPFSKNVNAFLHDKEHQM